MNYSAKLAQRIESVGSRLCVGIDPRPELSGGIDAVPEYLKRIVGETAEYAAAFKPNMAYFEAMGLRGIEMLQDMLQQMPEEV
ncbi:MAG: orotidine-5'-phosphate decarboxylase, partial [Verrucomicrobiaceae bacterium]|nr:orotidine-5'-phosphate decarboxylase [Verrucomicrobiaceae bacterium]